METLHQFLRATLAAGVPASQISAWQMALRSVLAYLAAIIIVRVSRRRFMGRNSAIDVIVAVTFGSTLSRGLTGNAPLGPVLAACAALAGADWLLAAIGVRFDKFDCLLKGAAVPVVDDGKALEDRMRSFVISRRDLTESVRLQGKVTSLEQVATASLERNGGISVITQEPTPRVVDVRVEAGVQTVRIEIP